jgi:hypothetical protein
MSPGNEALRPEKDDPVLTAPSQFQTFQSFQSFETFSLNTAAES